VEPKGTEEGISWIEPTPSQRGVRLFGERNDHWGECPSYNLNVYLK
jgi:hypothetical protein